MREPFGSESLTGLELELLAPAGVSRIDLAQALAKAWDGELRYGLKYSSEGLHRDARPICTLTPAYRVDVQGTPRVTIVDDTTIQAQLNPSAATPKGLFRVVMDDVRFALWLQRNAWSSTPQLESVLAVMLETFEGSIESQGRGTRHSDQRALIDPYGHPLAVIAPLPGERDRVAEVVTAPLAPKTRNAVLQTVCEQAQRLGFTVPLEAAFHMHVDAAPWRSTPKLAALINAYTEAQSSLQKQWETNPRCKRLGGFSEALLKVAAETPNDLSFPIFAAALEMGGATKGSDLNLLGVIQLMPVQPTLEIRPLGMSLKAQTLIARMESVEAFLSKVWHEAT